MDDLQNVKLKKPNLRKAQIVNDVLDSQAEWSYVPDTMTLAEDALATEIGIALPRFTKSLDFSARAADTGVALDVLTAQDRTGATPVQRESWSLQPFRLSTGQLLAPVVLGIRTTEAAATATPRPAVRPAPSSPAEREAAAEALSLRSGALLSIGRDADLAVLRTNQSGRLDVWSLPDGRHLAAWRPYGEEPPIRRHVLWAAALPNRHVLTLNFEGRLIRWQLPECRAIYERNLGPQRALAGTSNLFVSLLPGLSPNHRHLAVWAGRSLLLLDVDSGACLAMLGGQSAPGLMQPTFHPDGSELAATLDQQGTQALVIYDLLRGAETGRIVLPPDTWPTSGNSENRHGGFTWVNKQIGVVGGRVAVNLARQQPVWRFDRAELNPVLDPPPVTLPGPGFWYYETSRQVTFNRVNLAAETTPAPAGSMFAVEPGSVIEVVDKTRAPEDVAQELRESLLRSLATLGFQTAEKQPVKLVIESELRDSPRQITLRTAPTAAAKKPVKDKMIATQELLLKASFVVRGKTAWSLAAPYRLQSLETMPADAGLSAEQWLLQTQWERAVRYAPDALFGKIPRYVADPNDSLPTRPYPPPSIAR